jgi:hypothetical protein
MVLVKLLVNKRFERNHGTIRLVLAHVTLSIRVEAQCGERLHLVRDAEGVVLHAVNLDHFDSLTVVIGQHRLCKRLPHRLQPLAPDAPWRVEIGEDVTVLRQVIVELCRVYMYGLLSVLVQLYQ